MKITIVDYGMGNIYSVKNAIHYLGAEHEYSNDPVIIKNAEKIILPGVGSFKKAMQNIIASGLNEAICKAASSGIPILGICLGMQLLGKSSTEDGFTEGLCLFDGIVEKLNILSDGVKIPHIGFNEVKKPLNSILYQNINDLSDFYFIHSYRMLSSIESGIAYSSYGEKFIASFEYNNIFGTQFHPEKSQTNGLLLLKNFIEY
jgi:glutamine amidotransferase